ncbi:MAG: hypothetical protein LBG97_06720 [Coriobacteriales bacterium]|jgi:hypothetical protein|nr:hypothetical protein [Coriobacteriales bacterium]
MIGKKNKIVRLAVALMLALSMIAFMPVQAFASDAADGDVSAPTKPELNISQYQYATKNYNGQEQKFAKAFVVTGLINGDKAFRVEKTIEVTETGEWVYVIASEEQLTGYFDSDGNGTKDSAYGALYAKNAGSYFATVDSHNIIIKDKSGNDVTSNYDINGCVVSYRIEPKTVKVKFTGPGILANQWQVPAGTDPAAVSIGYTMNGLVAGEEALANSLFVTSDYSTSKIAGESMAAYLYVVENSPVPTDYKITSANFGTLNSIGFTDDRGIWSCNYKFEVQGNWPILKVVAN